MILTKEIEVTINYRNIEHFKSLGYDIKHFDKIKIPIDHISKQSNVKIDVECDFCRKRKIIKYQSYVKGTDFGKRKYACCSKCAWFKNRETNLIKYGVEAPQQNDDVRNKTIKTVSERYGVDNISKTEIFKTKYKDAMLSKYGVENGFKSEEVKSKARKTMLYKYGVEYNMQREDMKEKFLNGDKNNFYIHGEFNPQEWQTKEAKATKIKVFRRDDRKCVICGSKQEIECHHLYSRNTHKHLIYDEGNCVTLCKNHHRDFHNTYGYGKNTKDQYFTYINRLID